MSDDTVEESNTSDRGERGFLHDISSPLAVGQGNLRIIISKLKADPPAIDGKVLLDKLEKVASAVDKIVGIVNDRRIATRRERPNSTEEN